jgi:hypothetical protein
MSEVHSIPSGPLADFYGAAEVFYHAQNDCWEAFQEAQDLYVRAGEDETRTAKDREVTAAVMRAIEKVHRILQRLERNGSSIWEMKKLDAADDELEHELCEFKVYLLTRQNAALAAEPGSQDASGTAGRASEWISHEDLAAAVGKTPKEIESWLRRFRNDNLICCEPIKHRAKNERGFLYRRKVVLPALKKHFKMTRE